MFVNYHWKVAGDILVRGGDKQVIPKEETIPEESTESKGTNTAVLVLAIVLPIVMVLVITSILIVCLVKRNKNSNDGMYNFFSYLQRIHYFLIGYNSLQFR
jgi:hypothetical protein